jgi:hypothetical protein
VTFCSFNLDGTTRVADDRHAAERSVTGSSSIFPLANSTATPVGLTRLRNTSWTFAREAALGGAPLTSEEFL